MVTITVIIPKNKMNNGWNVLMNNILHSTIDQKALITTVGGDHYLIETSEKEAYIEYLTETSHENLKNVWGKLPI